MSLSLVGQIAAGGTRANYIGKANAASFTASILGSLSAGALYEAFGFTPVFAVIVVLTTAAWIDCFHTSIPTRPGFRASPSPTSCSIAGSSP